MKQKLLLPFFINHTISYSVTAVVRGHLTSLLSVETQTGRHRQYQSSATQGPIQEYSHRWPSSLRVLASPGHLSAPQSTCPTHPLFLSASSIGQPTPPQAEGQNQSESIS